MNKLTKRILSACLAIAMVLTMLPSVTAQAATTEKLTMYVGEAFSYSYYMGVNKITSVSSSKKAVATITKDKSSATKCIIKAKKAGSATLTIKGKNYSNKTITQTIKLTVKKTDFKVSFKQLDNTYLLATVKNNTKQTFDSAKLKYTLRDTNGEEVEIDEISVNDLVAGKSAYKTIYIGDLVRNGITIDCAGSSGKVIDFSRSPSYKYTDASSKLTCDVTEENTGDNEVTLTLKYKNKAKESVSGYIYIILYDAAGSPVGLLSHSVYLKKGGLDTQTKRIDTKYGVPAYDHYKVIPTVYTREYIN